MFDKDSDASYVYEPLDTDKSHIRLLRIKSDGSDPIPSCEIAVFELSDAPSYIGLSYTWDPDDAPKATIYLNGRRHEVGQTVRNFLGKFETPDENSFWGRKQNLEAYIERHDWIWIDQVCIHQTSVAEKNHQVALMSTIYSMCKCTISWLGVSTYPAALEERYFTRIWVTQEVILAPIAYLLFEDRWSSRKRWMDYDEISVFDDLLPNLVMKRSAREKNTTLAHAICDFSSRGCKDPRDKVYAILSLCSDGHLVPIDYNKSVQEVFEDVVWILLQNCRWSMYTASACEVLATEMSIPRGLNVAHLIADITQSSGVPAESLFADLRKELILIRESTMMVGAEQGENAEQAENAEQVVDASLNQARATEGLSVTGKGRLRAVYRETVGRLLDRYRSR